jgi:hypothetical protein
MLAPRRRPLPRLAPALRAPGALSPPAWAPAAAVSGLVSALLVVGAVLGGVRFDAPWAAGILAAAAAGLAAAAALTIRLHHRRPAPGAARSLRPAGAEELRVAAIERVLGAACELLPATRALVVRFREEAIEAVALADGGALRTAVELGGVTPSPLAALVRRHGRVTLLAPCPAAEVAVAVGLGVPPASARSIAWIPLSANGALVGALCLTSDDPDGFGPDQAPTFQAVGALVGAALDAHGVLDRPGPGEAADGVTGLAGRRAFVERLAELMTSVGRRRAGLCLATMVLDEAPYGAGAPGEQAGERLLREAINIEFTGLPPRSRASCARTTCWRARARASSPSRSRDRT